MFTTMRVSVGTAFGTGGSDSAFVSFPASSSSLPLSQCSRTSANTSADFWSPILLRIDSAARSRASSALPPSCSALECLSLATSTLAIVRKELICASLSCSFDFNSSLNASSLNKASSTGKVTATVLASVFGEGDGEGDAVGLGPVDTELELPAGRDMQPVTLRAKAANNPGASERQSCFITSSFPTHRDTTSVVAISSNRCSHLSLSS